RIKQIGGSSPKNLHVIHNVPMYQPKTIEKGGRTENKLTICYIGTLSKNRFLPELLKYVSSKGEVQLIIGGYGPIQDLVDQYSKKYSNIKFLGEVTYAETFKYYSNTDLMIAMYDPSLANHKY